MVEDDFKRHNFFEVNFKQKLLRALYPLIMWLGKSQSDNGRILSNDRMTFPKVS